MIQLKGNKRSKKVKMDIFDSYIIVASDEEKPNHKYQDDSDVDVLLDDAPRTKKPKRYKVYVLNDDFTTMEFVIEVLMSVFNKTFEESEKLMLEIHQKGSGVAGVYTYEVAETKAMRVISMAQSRSYPLQCGIEPE